MDAEIMPMLPSVMKVQMGVVATPESEFGGQSFSPAKDGIAQETATGANGLVVSAHANSLRSPLSPHWRFLPI
jgi:hypothetical protein